MNRKEQILQVVIDKIKQNNLTSEISLSSIAREVNIGKSTIYEYFSSKEELLKLALFSLIEDAIQNVTIAADLDTYTFEELFKEQMKRLLEAAYTSRLMLETMQPKFASQFSDETREEMKQLMLGIRDNIRDRFIKFFEKGIQEGKVSSAINELDGYIVTSLVVGTIITYSDPRVEIDSEIVIQKLYDTIIKITN